MLIKLSLKSFFDKIIAICPGVVDTICFEQAVPRYY